MVLSRETGHRRNYDTSPYGDYEQSATVFFPLAERGPDSLLEPDAIAAQYLQLHQQPPSAWTFELDLRPWTEPF